MPCKACEKEYEQKCSYSFCISAGKPALWKAPLGIPVVTINMMDVVKKNGDKINTAELSCAFGCKVVAISALKGAGIVEAAEAVVDAAKNGKAVATDWANDGLFGDGWHLFGIGTAAYEEAMNDYVTEHIWTAEMLSIVGAAAEEGVIGAEEIRDAIAKKDFDLFDEAYGSYADSLSQAGYDISAIYDGAFSPAWLSSLLVDGIIGGVGAVLGFVPQMIVLFLLLAFLESCGYMARIAFVLDRIFRNFGLSGKSFIPMLIGTGCGVPGIMASRTIETERDRRMTIMTTTFIPCGAKLPLIALIASALFGGAWWVAPSAYFIGVASIIISGIMLKKTKKFAEDLAPFVMELPAYHWPTVENALRSMWERVWSFVKKAGTIILLSSIVIWASSRFGIVNSTFSFSAEMDLDNSVLGMVGNSLCWIFAPSGFGNIKATVATIMGLVAKEEVVGVFGVLDFEGMSRLVAYSFLVFNLLCAPCFAAIGAIRREMHSARWTCFAIGYQCMFAYAISLMLYQFGSVFTGNLHIIGLFAAVVVLAVIIYMLFIKRNLGAKEAIRIAY